MEWVSLHHHSCFSYMDGHKRPDKHVERIAELGGTALALTEHGNVSSHVQLEKSANKAGIKPIFGLEAYTTTDPTSRRKFHLTLLAMDQEGYSNLMQIVSASWENYYQWPTVSGEILARYNEGIIVLSGCSDSLLACSLLGGKTIPESEASYDRAERQALKFKALLGDRFYLETQMFPELDRTRAINGAYERLSREANIPLVATADCHYPHPDDNEIQVILHAAGRGAGSVAAQEASWEYGIRLAPPDSDRKVLERLRGTGLSSSSASAALSRTTEIAARCNVVLPKADRLRYPIDKNPRIAKLLGPGGTSLDLIWQLMREGWAYRIKQGNRNMANRSLRSAYTSRLRHEMGQIVEKDFVDYFLMLSDLVSYAKDHGVGVGPARGSAAASLACYLLRITEIDPLQYPMMMFDRFIDPTRTDLPDVDLDFDDDIRYKVRERAVEVYGAERVGNIANYSRYKGKTAVNDVGRVFRLPFVDVELVKSMIIERSGGDSRDDFSLMDTVEMFPVVKDAFERNPDLYKAIRLEGDYRGMSVHAAGIVISNTPITDICALYTKEHKASGNRPAYKVQAVSVDKKDAEYLNLLKADFLGLSTMGMIRIALGIAGLTLEDLYKIPMDEPETLKAFYDNDVIGIFQWEGRATRLVNREVQPETFDDLTHVNTLSRPGPLFSGTTEEYIQVRHGRAKPTSFHPIIDKLTENTRGQFIFQEQILRGLAQFGGLEVGRVHEIRRIISKKLGEAQFNTHSADFIARAVELHGVTPELAQDVWGRLVTSASYVFNIAHSVSYSMLAFWAMWLKTHHTVAFYTAQLQKTEKEKWPRLIKDAAKHGVKVLGVDAALSGETWTPVGDHEIRAGFQQLNGVGPAIMSAIVKYRAGGGTLETPEDFLAVRGIGPKILETLKVSMNDPDPFGLQKTGRSLQAVRDAIATREIPLRPPTHSSNEVLDAPEGSVIRFVGMVKFVEYKDYIENQRSRTGEEVEDIRRKMKRPDLLTYASLLCYDEGDEDVYLRINRYAFPRFKTMLGKITLNHDVVWAVAKKAAVGVFGASLQLERLFVLDPEV